MADSPATDRRREAAAAARAETSRRLLAAAGAEFAERGYHAATVTRIAARAGVTVQTLYLAWGSKRELLRAHMDAALAEDPGRSYADQLPSLLADTLDPAGGDPQAAIRRFAHLYRDFAERAALAWGLYRDAAATDAEAAADWQTLQQLRHRTLADVIGRIPASGLRAGLTPEAAADTAWTIASPQTHELLVGTQGYTLDQYERWVADTLIAALLAPDEG